MSASDLHTLRHSVRLSVSQSVRLSVTLSPTHSISSILSSFSFFYLSPALSLQSHLHHLFSEAHSSSPLILQNMIWHHLTIFAMFLSNFNFPIGTWRSFNEIYRTNYDTYTHPVTLKGLGYDLYEKEKEILKKKSSGGKKKRISKESKSSVGKFENIAITSTWTLHENQRSVRWLYMLIYPTHWHQKFRRIYSGKMLVHQIKLCVQNILFNLVLTNDTTSN